MQSCDAKWAEFCGTMKVVRNIDDSKYLTQAYCRVLLVRSGCMGYSVGVDSCSRGII